MSTDVDTTSNQGRPISGLLGAIDLLGPLQEQADRVKRETGAGTP
ncbi:hypothetical protein [Alkalinema sp. FACHB-956]|nr:hypothetical protein [Alkalinema sp. FACHB-956]